MKKITKYILVSMVALFATILIVKAAPTINILGNRAVVGTGLNATTTANAHLTASGTIAFVSLGSSGNPCLTIGTDGTLATSTCGGAGGGVSTSTPFTAGYIPFATSSISLTNSNIFQSGSNIGIGTTTPSFLLEVLGDLKINTSSTLGNIISGVWNGTAIGDSYISSASNWNTAYTDRLKWDGGATGLVAATGRTSLELGSMALLANTGSSSITTIGTIGAGTWQGTAIGDSYISSASNWNSKATSTLTLTAGSGLTGGGNLTADRTFTVGAGTGITVNADTIDNSGVLSLGTATGTITLQSPLVMTSNVLSMPTSTTAVNGYLSATDWTTFNTRAIGFNVFNATTTATATTTIQKQLFQAMTITQITCATNGSNITIGADERASSTPDTLGTDVFNGGSLSCTSAGNSTSTFANATIAGNAILNFDLDSIPNSTTTLRVNINYKND